MGDPNLGSSAFRAKMGRRKIEMAYLEDDRVRKVTFCKRKQGLFKKAHDLAALTGVSIAVIIHHKEGKTNHFASTSATEDFMKTSLEDCVSLTQGWLAEHGANMSPNQWGQI